MALQSSGQISLQDIHDEAGGTTNSTAQASINDTDIRELISKSSGTLMAFNEWYGAEAETTAVSGTAVNGQSNLQEITVSDYISSGGIFVIPSNFWIWSDSTSTPALIIDIPCTIKNNGYIIGKGGTGGAYSPSGSFSFTAGSAGGDAIKINSSVSNVTIINNSGAFIAGGGGGGGSSVDNSDPADKGAAGGGGAGGGAGGNGLGGNSGNQFTGGPGGPINGYGSNAGFTSNNVYVDFVAPGFVGYGGGSGGGCGGQDFSSGRRAGGGGGRRLDAIVEGSYTGAPNTFPRSSTNNDFGCTGSHTGAFGGVGVGSVSGGTDNTFFGAGGAAGGAAPVSTVHAGGGGGWGQAGGTSTKSNNNKKSGGAAGKAIEDNGNSFTLSNSGTIYGATT